MNVKNITSGTQLRDASTRSASKPRTETSSLKDGFTPAEGSGVVAMARPTAETTSVKATPAAAAALSDVSNQVAQAVLQGTVLGAAGVAIASTFKTGFVKGYLEPKAVLETCQKLAADYPDLVEIITYKDKTHGYDGKNQDVQGQAPLYVMRIGPKTADRDKKLGVFQFAAPHAREWINPMTMVELAQQLVQNYDPTSTDPLVQKNTQLLQNLDIFIAPQTNPDGANYSFFDDNMWRKNRAEVAGGEHGVDINRNYPYQWTPSDNVKDITYSGPSAASEIETQHIMSVVDQHPNIRFVCDWHSYSEEIRRPEGVSEPDLAVYQNLQKRMADAIAHQRGRQYGQVVSKLVSGTSDDYFYNSKATYGLLVETGKSFQPDSKEAVAVKDECVEGAKELLATAYDYSLKHGLEPAHPAKPS
jgi:hypothetical protein